MKNTVRVLFSIRPQACRYLWGQGFATGVLSSTLLFEFKKLEFWLVWPVYRHYD